MSNLIFPYLLGPLLLSSAAQPTDSHVETALFQRCSGQRRLTCVVDGDTIWLKGTKIRLADINTPEIFSPDCETERTLGELAAERLMALLNAGAFSLTRSGRDEDYFGRKLRVVMRDGKSLGAVLVDEGLAEFWSGRRGDWCTAPEPGLFDQA